MQGRSLSPWFHVRLGILIAFAAFVALPAYPVSVDSLPAPTGYVSDLAHVVDPTQKQVLESFCTKVEQQLGVQFALVTIDTLGDEPIENFTLELFRKWGVGSKKDNQGVLLLLAVKDRKSALSRAAALSLTLPTALPAALTHDAATVAGR